MLRQLIAYVGFAVLLSAPGYSQPYLVQGSIEHLAPGKVLLASYYGDRFNIVDSLHSSSGSFLFMLSEDSPAGVYRLFFSDEYQGVRSENHFVEFIYNREDLTLNVSVDEQGPVPSFESSTENQVYLEFMAFQLSYEDLLTEIYPHLLETGPEDERFVWAAQSYEELQARRSNFMDSLSLLYPELYATRIMNAFRTPEVKGSLSHRERIEELKQHFFDLAPIEDAGLLYAPVYPFRIVDYLSLYRVDTLTMEEQEEAFMEAVDQIMMHVPPHPELYPFIFDFLLQGFELLGMEQVQLHLSENYMDASCESDLTELVQARMEGYRKMKVGALAPDFTVRDAGGAVYTLSQMSAPYTLVMFWSSTCGHCREMMPQLKRFYLEENSPEFEVLAISIDSSATLYESYIAEEPMPWISVFESQGWQGLLASRYQIYATPSFFLVDRKLKILARPTTVRHLQKSLQKLQ